MPQCVKVRKSHSGRRKGRSYWLSGSFSGHYILLANSALMNDGKKIATLHSKPELNHNEFVFVHFLHCPFDFFFQ